MQTKQQLQPADYAKAVADMSLERAAQVYDFVRYLQRQSTYPSPITAEEDDWLADSEEQMQAEDALWDASLARHQDKFAALAAAGRD